MDQAQFDQTIAKINAETLRLIDETAKINGKNPYAEMAIGSAVTVVIVVVLGLVT